MLRGGQRGGTSVKKMYRASDVSFIKSQMVEAGIHTQEDINTYAVMEAFMARKRIHKLERDQLITWLLFLVLAVSLMIFTSGGN